MKASTKRILSIGLSGLFFLAIILVYINLIRPELSAIEKKRSLVVSKETLFNNQVKAVDEVQKLISEFQSTARLQETVSLAMPLHENVTEALNQLQAIARNSQTNITSFSLTPLALEPGRQPLAKRLGTLELAIAVQGSYEGLKNFVKSLETNVRVTNINNFRIAPINLVSTQDFYVLNLKAEMYHQE